MKNFVWGAILLAICLVIGGCQARISTRPVRGSTVFINYTNLYPDEQGLVTPVGDAMIAAGAKPVTDPKEADFEVYLDTSDRTVFVRDRDKHILDHIHFGVIPDFGYNRRIHEETVAFAARLVDRAKTGSEKTALK